MDNVITRQKGNYILVMSLEEPTEQLIPMFGKINFLAGNYLYCGSAHGNGGLRSRVTRHLAKESKRFWHVDHIKHKMQVQEVWYQIIPENTECGYSRFLAYQNDSVIPIERFGASDCRNRCKSHLIMFPKKVDLNQLFICLSRLFDGMSRFYPQIL